MQCIGMRKLCGWPVHGNETVIDIGPFVVADDINVINKSN